MRDLARKMCATDPDLQRFLEARELLREWLVTKEELLWRIRYILPERDRFRKATERLLYNSGVSHFQSYADDCVARFGAAQANGRFPRFDSFIDVFYNDAQQVVTRVPHWSKRSQSGAATKEETRRAEAEARAADFARSVAAARCGRAGARVHASRARAAPL